MVILELTRCLIFRDIFDVKYWPGVESVSWINRVNCAVFLFISVARRLCTGVQAIKGRKVRVW